MKQVRSVRLPVEKLLRALHCLGGVRPECAGVTALPADARVVGAFVEAETRSVLLHLESDCWPEVDAAAGDDVRPARLNFLFRAHPHACPEELALVRLAAGRVVPARVERREVTDYGWETFDALYQDGDGVAAVTWPAHRARIVCVPLADMALLPEVLREAELAVAGKDRPPPSPLPVEARKQGKNPYWLPGPDA